MQRTRARSFLLARKICKDISGAKSVVLAFAPRTNSSSPMTFM